MNEHTGAACGVAEQGDNISLSREGGNGYSQIVYSKAKAGCQAVRRRGGARLGREKRRADGGEAGGPVLNRVDPAASQTVGASSEGSRNG